MKYPHFYLSSFRSTLPVNLHALPNSGLSETNHVNALLNERAETTPSIATTFVSRTLSLRLKLRLVHYDPTYPRHHSIAAWQPFKGRLSP